MEGGVGWQGEVRLPSSCVSWYTADVSRHYVTYPTQSVCVTSYSALVMVWRTEALKYIVCVPACRLTYQRILSRRHKPTLYIEMSHSR